MFTGMSATDMPCSQASEDWHPADIKAALEKAGWTFRRLDKARGYCPGTLHAALHRPYPKAERIIAHAIRVKPWEIWPSRYDDDHKPNRRMGRPKVSPHEDTPKHTKPGDGRNVEVRRVG